MDFLEKQRLQAAMRIENRARKAVVIKEFVEALDDLVGFLDNRSARDVFYKGKKNGRSEERPSSGRKRPGRAAASQSKITIPRCNNMSKSPLVCKAQSITILDKTPQKSWEKLSQLP